MMIVHFQVNDKGVPTGKLADAELHFEHDQPGPHNGHTYRPDALAGLKLIGFAIWQRKGGGLNVTFPTRQYSVNGERRSFALLRSIVDAMAQDTLKDVILQAWADHVPEVR